MLISKIQWIDKKRCRVYMEERIAFVLYKGDLSHLEIKEQEELSEEKYRIILEELLPKRAKLRLLHLLKNKDYTEQQLRTKLREGHYPQEVTDQAIAYVKEYGYVNDERYAKRFFECYGQRKSLFEMKQKLMEKGISKELVSQVANQWMEECGGQEEDKMVRSILEKRKFGQSEDMQKEWQKHTAYLCKKGYSMDVIHRVMKEMLR